MFKIFKSKLRAVSLAEVMVVLVISATTLILISRLTVNLLVTIKNDEIEDYATGIAVQTLELAKSPDALEVQTFIQTSDPTGIYAIDLNSSPIRLVQQSYGSPGSNNRITDCDESSPYLIDTDFVDRTGTNPSTPTNNPLTLNPLVCLQVIIQQEDDILRNDQYFLESITITRLGSEVRSNTIKGYRRGDFEITSR